MGLVKGSLLAHNTVLKTWESRRRNGNDRPWNAGTAKPRVKLTREQLSEVRRKSSRSFYERGGISWNKDKSRSEETRRKLRERSNEPWRKEISAANLRAYNIRRTPWNKGLTKQTSPKVAEAAEKVRLANVGKLHTEETKRKMSAAHINYIPTEETKEKLKIANKGQVPWSKGLRKGTSAGIRSQAEKLAEIWRDPSRKTTWVRKLRKAACLRPNKIETQLDELLQTHFPSQWTYTGDGSLIINGLIPDFSNTNGLKALIEVFGDYWHRGKNPSDRIEVFRTMGYRCLVVWESELKREPISVIARVQRFIKEDADG